jgi:glycosyltransferase involved in cell wall biosynthesis
MAIITAIILTYNEEKHIERCIQSILPLTSEIYIIDSYSTDGTVEFASRLGAKVLQNKWINHASQFNWGIKNSHIQTPWIIRMDADEYLTPELRTEMENVLPVLSTTVSGVVLNYRHYFMGRWIKNGTRYPLPLLRIWRTGKGSIENKWMDERVVLSEGTTYTLKSDFIHDDLNDINFFISKHNGYATREAIDLLNKEYHFMNNDSADNGANKSHINLVIKNSFYSKSPLFLRVLVYFIYRYFFRLGFLDGKEGLIYHFLQGFWYRFLVDAKIFELKRKFNNDSKAIVAYIKQRYQID